MVRAALLSEASVEAGVEFASRPTDVFISPYSKCGTTWLQQIVHGLRTGGDLEFTDISRVVPWVESALDSGIDLDAPQRAEPRAFKSHLQWDLVPKPGRYLVAVRDPADAVLSLYRFFDGWLFEPRSIELEAFVRGVFVDDGGYWRHLASWWRHRHDDDVCLLAYEDMKLDLAWAVRQVADFIGVGTEPERLAIAAEQASLESMLAHHVKYDEQMLRERSERVSNLPAGSSAAKVRGGSVAERRLELTGDARSLLDHAWRLTMTAEFGVADYSSLRDALPHRPEPTERSSGREKRAANLSDW